MDLTNHGRSEGSTHRKKELFYQQQQMNTIYSHDPKGNREKRFILLSIMKKIPEEMTQDDRKHLEDFMNIGHRGRCCLGADDEL